MTKDMVGDHKGFEERKMHQTAVVEARRSHNHELTKQARSDRRERHRVHTLEKHQDEGF